MCGSAAWLFSCHTDATSSQIATYTTTVGSESVTYSYTYDDNGNILSVVSNISNANSNTSTSSTTTYEYDSANQLIRENNEAADYTHTWTYDNAGNILQRKEYDYTDGSLTNVTVDDSVSYGYPAVTDPENNTVWGDKLTSYGDKAITYDQIGNPLSFGNRTYIWEHGRQLKTLTEGNTTWNYTYNSGGMRTGRTDGTTTYQYIYSGSQLAQMKVGSNTLNFTYDAAGVPLTVTYNGTKYYYTTNIQGDVVAILDSSGTQVASYTYDAWGNCLTAPTSGVGLYNPLRYRGYVYDPETGLYYVSSRYYDSEIGRWINADSVIAGVGGSIQGYNMFAYCFNNPVNMSDSSGHWPQWMKDAANWVNNNIIQPVANFFSPSTNTISGPFQDGIFRGSGSLTGGYSEFNWRLDDKIKSSGSQDGWVGGFGKASVGNANGKIGIGNDNLSASIKGVADGLVATAQAGLHYKDGFGVGAKAKASVLSGRATIEFNIFGWQVELGVSGDVLSAGAEATIGIFPTDDGGKQFDARYNVSTGWFGWGYVVRVKAPA